MTIDPVTGLIQWTPLEGTTAPINVTVEASDNTYSLGDSTSFQINVQEVLPVASLVSPSPVVRGQIASFILVATDPNPVDQAANFTFTIDWNGDGSDVQTIQAASIDDNSCVPKFGRRKHQGDGH